MTPTSASAATPTSASAATPTAPVGGAVDICSLLTPADLKAATGNDYLVDTESTGDGNCSWDTAEGDSINIYVLANPFGFNFHKDNAEAGGVDLTVSGHPAFYDKAQGAPYVDLGGGRDLSVWFAASQAIAVQLAEIALSKI